MKIPKMNKKVIVTGMTSVLVIALTITLTSLKYMKEQEVNNKDRVYHIKNPTNLTPRELKKEIKSFREREVTPYLMPNLDTYEVDLEAMYDNYKEEVESYGESIYVTLKKYGIDKEKLLSSYLKEYYMSYYLGEEEAIPYLFKEVLRKKLESRPEFIDQYMNKDKLDISDVSLTEEEMRMIEDKASEKVYFIYSSKDRESLEELKLRYEGLDVERAGMKVLEDFTNFKTIPKKKRTPIQNIVMNHKRTPYSTVNPSNHKEITKLEEGQVSSIFEDEGVYKFAMLPYGYNRDISQLDKYRKRVENQIKYNKKLNYIIEDMLGGGLDEEI